MAASCPNPEARRPYTVKLVDEVEDFIVRSVWSERVYSKMMDYMELLSVFPDLGTPYQPEYAAARPPFPCRAVAVPDTPFTLYYITLEEARALVVIFIENQASNPNERFNWGIVSL